MESSTVQPKTKITQLQKELDFVLKLVPQNQKHLDFKVLPMIVEAFNALFEADITFIGKITDTENIKTLIVKNKTETIANTTYPIKAALCETNTQKPYGFLNASELKKCQPNLTFLNKPIKSYLGIPLLSEKNKLLGVFVSLFFKPIEEKSFPEKILIALKKRVSAELEKLEPQKANNATFKEPAINFETLYHKLKEQYEKLSQTETELLASNEALIKKNQLLRDNEQKLKTAQRLSKLGSYLLNFDTGIWECSEELTHIFGIEPSDKKDIKLWTKLLYASDSTTMTNYFEKEVIAKQQPFNKEYRIVNQKTGKVTWIHGLGELRKNKNGKLLSMHGTIQDISERKHKDLELTSLYKKLTVSFNKLNESEEKYRALYMNAPLAYQSLDADGKVIDVNPAWLKTLGYEFNEVFGQWFGSFLTVKSKEHFKTNFKRFKALGCVSDVQFEMICKNGKEIVVLFEGCIGYDAKGNFKQTYCTFKEITQQKLAEKALMLSEERFNMAMEASTDGIWDWNLTNNSIYYSPGWKKMLGYTDHEIPNTFEQWEKLVDEDGKKRSWEQQKALINKETDRFEVEFKMKHKEGHYLDILARANIIFNSKGKAVRMIGTHTDITKLKKTEAALREREKQYQTLAENIPGIIFTCVFNDKLSAEFLNKGFEKLSKYKIKKKKQNHLLDYVYEPDIDNLKKAINESIKKQANFKTEIRIKQKGGNIIWCEIIGTPTIDSDGITKIQGIILDISQRKNNELLHQTQLQISSYAQLHNSTELISKVLDEAELLTNSSIGFYHFINEKEQTITLGAWSTNTSKYCRMRKYQSQYNIAEAGIWTECITTRKTVIHDNYDSLENKKRLPQGHVKLNNEMLIPVIREGLVVAILGVGNKATKYNKSDARILAQLSEWAFEIIMRKKTEEKVIEERNRSVNILEATHVGTWDWNVQSGALVVNQRWAEIMGYTLQELEPINIETGLLAVHPDDVDAMNLQLEKTFNKALDYYDIEFRQKHKNGSYVWVNSRGNVTSWSKSGKPLIMSGVHIDITERKINEQQLQESKERFKSMFYNHRSVMLLIDPNSAEIIEFNQAALDYYGYSEKEFRQLNVDDLNTLSKKEILTEMEVAKKNKQNFFKFKHRLKNGTIRNVNIFSSLIPYGDKSMLYSIIQDTEEQYKAQQALLESEQQLQLILDNSPAIMILVNEKTEIIRMNKTGLTISGYSMHEVKNKQTGDVFSCLHAISTDKGCGFSDACKDCVIRSTVNEVIKFKKPLHKIEADLHVVKNHNKKTFNVLVSSVLISNSPESIYLVTLEDITTQKKYESELAESYTKYKAVADHTYGWEYWKSPEGNYTYVSPSCERISGFSNDDFYNKPDLFALRVVEKDQEEWIKHNNNSLKQKIDEKPIEIRFKTKSGKIIWLEHVCKPVFSEKNEYLGQRGTNRDISKSKQDQLELIESKNRFKQLADINKEAIIILKGDIIIDINKSTAKISGYSEKELIGFNIFATILSDHLQENVVTQLQTSHTIIPEIELTHKKGKKYPAEISIRPISKSTKSVRVMAIRDITEQKQLQHKILNAVITAEESERKRVAQELHDGLGPILSATKLYMETFLKSDNEKFRNKARQHLLSGIEEALIQVATISNNLTPHVLIDFGLESALKKFTEKISVLNHIIITFTFDVKTTIHKDIEITLYRVFTELVNNTLKHAKAKNIEVHFFEQKQEICLIFKNDGEPFDFEKTKNKKGGMGLFNIINRVKSFNGTVDFNSAENKGVVYDIKIPTK